MGRKNMRKKKFKFGVEMKIEELSRISLLSGIFFCKARLTNGGDFAEQTSRESIDSNCVKWKNGFTFNCKLSASPTTGILETCVCRISVRKEVKGGKSNDKVGYVDVNLAEYAGAGLVTRHYILEGYDGKKNRQDNCILKISTTMTLTSGDPLFKPQDKPTDFLITGMGDTGKLSTSESFINAACGTGQEPGQVRRVVSESLDLPLTESPTHYQHKRNISNGSNVFRNTSGEIRNSGPPNLILSHSRQSSGTTADSACADLDTCTSYQSPLQRNKRSSHRRINEMRQNANDVVDQLFKVEDLMLDTSNADEGIELNMFLEDGVSTMSKIETRRHRDRGMHSFQMDIADRFKTL